MSVDAELRIRFRPDCTPKEVLSALLSSRWRPRASGLWCLSGDDFDWMPVEETTAESLSRRMSERHAAALPFGVRLWWDESETGGEFLLFTDGALSLSPSMHRVTSIGRASDVSWYLQRILPIFASASALALEDWTWRETA